MDFSYKQEVVSSCQGCTKIVLGQEKIKKIEKIYSAYDIPKSETILAHIRSSVFLMSLATDGAVITDQAYYFHPCHEDWAQSNRFPFSEICCYLVSQEGEKAHVVLSDPAGDYPVLGTTLFGKNIAGFELVRFFENVQKQLLQKYDWARKQRTATAHNFFNAFRARMRTGTLSEHDLKQLRTLKSHTDVYDEAVLLEAENLARLCDEKSYMRFVDSLSPALQADLELRYTEYLNQLKHDLSDITLEFDEAYLDKISSELACNNTLSDIQTFLLTYAYIRAGKAAHSKTMLEQIQHRFGQEKVQEVQLFKGRLYNQRMQLVFTAVAGGKMPDDSQLQWTDSVGLTPLHYAIIFNQTDLALEMIEKRKWKEPSPLSEEMGIVNRAYDYNVVACCANFKLREDLYQVTSDLILAQQRSINALRKKIWFKKQRIEVQKKTEASIRSMLRTGRQNDISQEKLDALYTQLDTITALKEDTMQEVYDLEQDISDIEAEIQTMTEYGLLETMNLSDQLRASNDSLAKYLLRIFSDPEYLRYILFDNKQTCKLYHYQNFHFITPYDVVLDLPFIMSDGNGSTSESSTHQEEREAKHQSKNASAIKRPYGVSWFSPEAHSNRKKLKEEYYKLAKQYHPDVCDHIYSQQIFQEILNERASILENMSQE